MNEKQKNIPLRMRLLVIILGMVFLFWLPIEDTTMFTAICFAFAICTWTAAIYLIRDKQTRPANLKYFILAGTIAGALVTPTALFILAFKTGLHGHQSPDFTTQQILSMIRKTPFWIIGGFLIGTGSGILITNRSA